MEALLLARLIKNTSELPDVLVRSLEFVMGPKIAELLRHELQHSLLRVPSPSTLSRTRLKLDVLAMLLRRTEFKKSAPVFVMLTTDSSPQGTLDLLLTLEDIGFLKGKTDGFGKQVPPGPL